MSAVDRVTFYADYVCPFCFFGHLSLTRYREERSAPLKIEWHPFDLRAEQRGPNGALESPATDGHDNAWEDDRDRVERLANRYDVNLAQPLAHDVDSWNAQLASVHVQMDHPTLWADFDASIYDALWKDGRNIGNPSVIVSIAADIGLDGEKIHAAIEDSLVERRLVDRFEAARLRSVKAVPTFVHGDQTVRGAVPPEHLRRVVEGAPERS